MTLNILKRSMGETSSLSGPSDVLNVAAKRTQPLLQKPYVKAKLAPTTLRKLASQPLVRKPFAVRQHLWLIHNRDKEGITSAVSVTFYTSFTDHWKSTRCATPKMRIVSPGSCRSDHLICGRNLPQNSPCSELLGPLSSQTCFGFGVIRANKCPGQVRLPLRDTSLESSGVSDTSCFGLGA